MRVKAAYRIVLYAWESTMRLVQNQRVVQYNEPEECTHFYNHRIRHQGRSSVPCQMHVPIESFQSLGRWLSGQWLLLAWHLATNNGCLTRCTAFWFTTMQCFADRKRKLWLRKHPFARGAALSICWLWKDKLVIFSVMLQMKCALVQSCTCEGGRKTFSHQREKAAKEQVWLIGKQFWHDHQQAGHMTGHQWKGNAGNRIRICLVTGSFFLITLLSSLTSFCNLAVDCWDLAWIDLTCHSTFCEPGMRKSHLLRKLHG